MKKHDPIQDPDVDINSDDDLEDHRSDIVDTPPEERAVHLVDPGPDVIEDPEEILEALAIEPD